MSSSRNTCFAIQFLPASLGCVLCERRTTEMWRHLVELAVAWNAMHFLSPSSLRVIQCRVSYSSACNIRSREATTWHVIGRLEMIRGVLSNRFFSRYVQCHWTTRLTVLFHFKLLAGWTKLIWLPRHSFFPLLHLARKRFAPCYYNPTIYLSHWISGSFYCKAYCIPQPDPSPCHGLS
jgi:hypothetical protein